MTSKLGKTRAIFLIVASLDPINQCDLATQELTWYRRIPADSKVIILRGHDSEKFDFDGKTLFVPCPESYENILQKTLLGLSWVLMNFDFELIIRSNVSTYFNVSELDNILLLFNPGSFQIGGFVETSHFNTGTCRKGEPFVTGTGIYLTQTSARVLIEMNFCDFQGMPDDLAISRFLIGRGAKIQRCPRVNLHSTHILINGFQTRLKSSEISDLASKRMLALSDYSSQTTFLGKLFSYLRFCKLEITSIHFDFLHFRLYVIRNFYLFRLNLHRLLKGVGS